MNNNNLSMNDLLTVKRLVEYMNVWLTGGLSYTHDYLVFLNWAI